MTVFYDKIAVSSFADGNHFLKSSSIRARTKLAPNNRWFAPLSPETGKIDPKIITIGEHRAILAARNIKAWLVGNGLPYHSPHKFRHGHIQHALKQAKTIADYKAISLNVLHANMEITDQAYSNINDGEVQNRISNLGKSTKSKEKSDETLIREFLEWKNAKELGKNNS